MLRRKRISDGELSYEHTSTTDRGEYPLQHSTIFIRLSPRIEGEFERGIVVLLQVQEYRGGLKDRKIVAVAIDEDRDATVRIQLDEPGFLLCAFGDVDLVDASWYQ